MPHLPYALQMLPAVEDELRLVIAQVRQSAVPDELSESSPDLWSLLHHMLIYHMGWTDENPDASGKRIRPMLLLLVAAAGGENWHKAVPAAAAVELLHNFSLIHDDIEDNSPLRRGRATVWKNWGVAQAINTGDVMFTLTHLAMLRLHATCGPEITLEATQLLLETCLALTQGQFLDLSYENERSLPLEAYWPMVKGKTASLLAACTELGALIARLNPQTRAAYQQFGLHLGLAFQIQDDLLGIWGDAALTGKSAASDLLTGKKSLPVLFGLSLDGPFARRWLAGPLEEDEVAQVADQLRKEGAGDYANEIALQHTEKSLQALESAQPQGEAGLALRQLANALLYRSA